MEWRSRERESAGEVPVGGPSLRVISRLVFLLCPPEGFVMIGSGFRVFRNLSKGVGASLLARVRAGSDCWYVAEDWFSCSLDGFVPIAVRGSRMLDCVEDSCACDFAARKRGLFFSGESGSLIEAGSKC